MKTCLDLVSRTLRTQLCCVLVILVTTGVLALDGPNVCMAEQKYNITKRIKYRAPMAVRTYEWCFSVPPRCSKWSTELRDLTRLETEERTAEVAVCCPGYKMTDISCVPICPNGKTGIGCSEDCPPKKWGPNCVNDCPSCKGSTACSPVTGKCRCQDGWQGESCEVIITTTISTTLLEDLLTSTNKISTTANAPPIAITPRNKTSMISFTTDRATTTTNQPTSSTLANFELTSNMTDSRFKSFGPNIKKTTITHFDNTSTSTTRIQSLITSTQKAAENIVTDRTPLKTFQTKNSTSTASPNKAESVTTAFMTTTELKYETKPTTTKNMFYSPEVTVPVLTTVEIKPEVETTYRPEIFHVSHSTTIKLKPKEIWIRPAQKGEHSSLETKTMHNQEQTHLIHRIVPRKELTSTITTPKTIVVSIIPTSISYTTFKKIAYTTSPHFSSTNSVIGVFQTKLADQKNTKSIIKTTYNSTPEVKLVTSKPSYSHRMYFSTTTDDFSKNSLKSPIALKKITTKSVPSSTIKSIVPKNHTNSMLSDAINKINSNFSINLTTPNVLTNLTKLRMDILSNSFHSKENILNKTSRMVTPIVATESNMKTTNNTKHKNTTTKPEVTEIKITDTVKKTRTLQNVATEKYKTKINLEVDPNITNTTAEPSDEETFHILTEPEHITAVMGEKATEKTSLDLVSVITIAGGVMMSVITVAVVIVMIERCKRPRYEEVRKINDIRMQVMIDNNDMPPPYVRSIFHTPLPDPPTSDKCHYQPISTLDRNLKQFMRPVVVQAISPVMLENFRDILECHYDHLPRRTQHFETLPARTMRSSLTPSINDTKELRHQRAVSVAETTIEALKCEAQFDVIDNTTAEPLYAEIPCWRPPSEHAIEVVTINGEAVTEL